MSHTRIFSTLAVGAGLCLSFCTNTVSFGQNGGFTAIESNYGNAAVPKVLIRPVSSTEQVQQEQIKELKPVSFQADSDAPAMVAAQINSVRNYAMLQPINSTLKSRSERTLNLPSPNANAEDYQRPLLVPKSTGMENHDLGFGGVAQGGVAQMDLASDSSVTISAKSFQRGFRDNFGFVVANSSDSPATSVVARLVAPEGSTIHQVIPKPVRVVNGIIEVEFAELAPGAEAKIEVAISYPKDELAQFQASIVASTVESDSEVLPTALTVDWAADEVAVPEANRETMLQPSLQESAASSPFTTVSTSKSIVKKSNGMVSEEIEQESIEVAEKSDVQLDLKTESRFIKTTVNGPLSLLLDEEADFSIDVTNLSSSTAEKVVIQLSIPRNLKVTVLDRAAWYDEEQGKLTWEQASLEPNQTEKIRYKAKAVSDGTVSQTVATGWRGVFQGEASLQSQAK